MPPQLAPQHPVAVRLGPFHLDLRCGELSQNGQRTRLQDQPLEIVRRLIERPGELVTRDELRERLWPNGTIVDFEHGVNSALKRLRDALGDNAEHPRFIETVPRRGYRLVVPVEVLQTGPGAGEGDGSAQPDVQPLQSGELLPLGHYRLLERVGSGSMGEVYRAEDVVLKRQVALKFISQEWLGDRDRLTRFQREAEVLAALDHPAIAAIYGLGEAGGRRFLVLEYVEGEPLSGRLARGPLRPSEAFDLCAHVADALAAAHQKGIVHRDIKPEHVWIRKDGRIKVLDFGLARIITPCGEPGADHRTSRPGLILGTSSYMSPEQASGRPVDCRTDIWALGCLLFECLTGSRAFQKESAVQTLRAVFEDDPDWTALPARLPPRVGALIRRCLRKDPDDRWQNARDLGDELRWLAASIDGEVQQGAHARPRGMSVRWAIAGGIGLLAMGALATRVLFEPRPPLDVQVRHMTVPVEAPVRLCPDSWTAGGTRTNIALSPDGRYLVFHGHSPSRTGLFIRALNRNRADALSGTEGGFCPVFSPDGRSIAYWADGEIRRIPAAGGPPVRICATGSSFAEPFGISWGDDGSIVYAIETGGLWRVPSSGGVPQPATQLQEGEISHRLPYLLPGGRAVVYTARSTWFSWGHEQLVVESLDTHERRVILDHGADARFVAPGYLVFMDLGRLAAVPFDAKTLEVTGSSATLIADVSQAVNEVNSAGDSGAGQFSVSGTGDLAYVAAPGGVAPLVRRTLAWVDRRGKVTPVPMLERALRNLTMSPDARRAALVASETTRRDAWLFDLEGGTWTRVTEGADVSRTTWSPDGRELAISMSGGKVIRQPLIHGVAPREILRKTGQLILAADWSTRGVLAIVQGPDYARFDIAVLDVATSGSVPTPFVASGAAETYPAFSPDGAWLAYVSEETGQREVYVTPYPGPGERTQVSKGGGFAPSWNPDGREVFYASEADRTSEHFGGGVTPGLWMCAVRVAHKGATLELGQPRRLFRWPDDLLLGASTRTHAVSADGQRFLAMKSIAEPPVPTVTHINLVENWMAEVKANVPATKR